jgi:peptidoglycan/xylan/chitin deacetylase (PgdA/CDA1 family)
MKVLSILFTAIYVIFVTSAGAQSWIRINQLGYTPLGIKSAVWCSKSDPVPTEVYLVNTANQKTALVIKNIEVFGAYGPFTKTARVNFSSFITPGTYQLKTASTSSPVFTIGIDVYKGAADFCLRYMRQQRTGFNPSINDSCHTEDGYTLYGPMPDSTKVDVVGGWHDASDYLQYASTSANATWHLLAAYRDFPNIFKDVTLANGLPGTDGIKDVLNEANWGLQWLEKMNPSAQILFNQIGDDRDHMKMRMPGMDTNYYGKGFERPVYFVNGKPQQRGKFMNATTGAASAAGKFASSFALASYLYAPINKTLSNFYKQKAIDAYAYGLKLPGFTQTVSVKSPYIYAENNWVDDMELAAASIGAITGNKIFYKSGFNFANQEPVTPWLGKDTAAHYQWYPFINIGHYELAKNLIGKEKNTVATYYKAGIEAVWQKAKQNAFYRGVPFIWCSNNLTTSFAVQCYWYKQLTGNKAYEQLEQANVDWLFGCNPWGTSMVYGLPASGDTPTDPHSAFTHIKNIPIDGGLVDGPVYTSIFNNLIGIQLTHADDYANFQSNLSVYHDDYGDYSTNEPTMDGTASLIYLLAAKQHEVQKNVVDAGAIIRGDTTTKKIYLLFTGDQYADGLSYIFKTLQQEKIKGSFFFTGNLYRNKKQIPTILELHKNGHYLGPHSNAHLLYNDWKNRDSLLVTKDSLQKDIVANEKAMALLGIKPANKWMVPPYEWWNQNVANSLAEKGYRLVSFTPGTRTNADYTDPSMGNAYMSSEKIKTALQIFEKAKTLNGGLILIHVGTDHRRTDKFYHQLPALIRYYKNLGYSFETVNALQ